jgi:thiamine-phosphate pyrophosphorylase
MIQIRERDLEASDLSRLVAAVVRMARGTGTRVVVNDRLDVALSCGAAGVHLRTDSMPPSAARSIVPQGFLVGRSVHDAAEAAAVAPFVDYVIAGTIWPSESKGPGPPVPPPIGPAGLRAIARVVSVPVLAIGGVTLETIAEAAAAGAAGIAAIGLFMRSRGQPGEPVCRAMPLGSAVEQARERFDTPHRAS